ncbi:MAG: serine/threonine-protein kinase [Kofleriaceae bacterium]
MKCPSCTAEVFEIDVKCPSCGVALAATGAHRMLGQVVLSVYELVDVIGQGGMSVVYKARHKLTEQEVALKILPPELAAHSQFKSRFLEEARALAALDHPNIVHLYNFGQENQSFVLAMQFVRGKTWERLILESQRLAWADSVKIAIDVLKALEYAHGRGVVHRDMKPSNVLVRAHDHMATVMDFGIAKMTTSTKLTATGQTMGTVRYMSPEQVRGQEVDLRTDIYSLGATLYESLVGDTPFDGSTHFEIMTKHLSEAPKRPSTLGVEVPPAVEDALMRSLAKRATDRFETARDLRLVLEAALREGDVGLSETQRLGGDAVADLRRTPISRGPGQPRPATSLADELEPAPIPTAQVARPRRTGLYATLGLIVLAGGGAASFFALRDHHHAYESVAKIEGVTLTTGKQFGPLLVETDGTVTPDAVYTSYVQTEKALLDSSSVLAAVRLEVVQHMVVVPQHVLCRAALFPNGDVPRDCATAKSEVTFGKDGKHLLLLAGQPGGLAMAMRSGLANAVCVFQPADLAPDKVDAICAATKKFAPPEHPGNKPREQAPGN